MRAIPGNCAAERDPGSRKGTHEGRVRRTSAWVKISRAQAGKVTGVRRGKRVPDQASTESSTGDPSPEH